LQATFCTGFKLNALDVGFLRLQKEVRVKRYRRIEITAFRRRVTVTSGKTEPDVYSEPPLPTSEGVWLNDADSGEAIEFESEEGQLILADAVRSLERRLSPEARDAILTGRGYLPAESTNPTRLYFKLYSLYQRAFRKVLHFAPKEN
jgi:hypothetical protein